MILRDIAGHRGTWRDMAGRVYPAPREEDYQPMFRVTYDNEHLTGELTCAFCGDTFELTGNVHTYTDDAGIIRTYPDARLKIQSHFRLGEDPNAFIPVCATRRLQVGTTPWEATDQTGRVVARGRVVVRQIGNAIHAPSVEQYEPIPAG